MSRDLWKIERDQLETLIDASNVSAVLEALSEICGEKAEHVETNWQDRTTARLWREVEGVIGCAAADVSKRGL